MNQRKRCVLTQRSPATDAPSPNVPMGWEDSAERLKEAYDAKTFNCDVCGEDKTVSERHHGYPYGLETTWCDACGESSLVTNTKQKLVDATIERCARIADQWTHSESCMRGDICEHIRLAYEISQRIRSLKGSQ